MSDWASEEAERLNDKCSTMDEEGRWLDGFNNVVIAAALRKAKADGVREAADHLELYTTRFRTLANRIEKGE